MTTPQSNSLLEAIFACELQVWTALAAGDPKADAAALHDSFLGVYADGFANKTDHVAQLGNGPTIAQFDLTDARVRALGADYALLSYRAVFRRLKADQDEVMFVSSIWQRKGDGWINIFSQDTPA